MKVLLASLFLSLLFFEGTAIAEPWMANRFAQNCAACHAPGRLNRKPSKRRCTLSCQGCHVNPNGGGLRNEYGKWNSERWARSFYTKLAWNKHSPAPLKKQHYAKKKLSKKKKKIYAKRGANLVGIPGVVKNTAPYKESSNYVSAKSMTDELARMTRHDPYRQAKRNPITAGGDLRLFYIAQSEGAPSQALEDGTLFPMVFDFGVRVRPIRNKLSFVYEGRAFNSSVQNPSSLDKLFAGGAMTRSAYILVDDLWYNSYAQYGLYRPMFGIYNANHNALMADYTKLGYSARVKALGFGTAPNVPFGMINIIMPTETAASSTLAAQGGFHVTAGLRFVSYGASLIGSYWDTKEEDAALPYRTQMWNINAAGTLFDRLIVSGEMTNLLKEANGLDEIKIMSVDAKFRFWREMYLQGSYTVANGAVARQNTSSQTGISPGSGSEMTVGMKAFIISGLEIETLMSNKVSKEDNEADYKEDTLQVQLHGYF